MSEIIPKMAKELIMIVVNINETVKGEVCQDTIPGYEVKYTNYQKCLTFLKRTNGWQIQQTIGKHMKDPADKVYIKDLDAKR